MALSVETTSSTTGTSVMSLTFSHTVTSANKIVVTVGIGNANGVTISGVTFNGDALSFVAGKTDSNPWCRVEIWERHNPDVVTGNVVVTFSGTTYHAAAGCTGYIGAAEALGSPSTNGASTANPTVTVVDSANGDLVTSVMMTDGSVAATTPAGTQLWEVENLGSDCDINAQYQTASGASTVCSWTNSTTDNYAAAGVAVKPFVAQPVALRAANTATANTVTVLSVTAPTGTVAGDLVVILGTRNAPNAISDLVDDNGATPFTKDRSDLEVSNGLTLTIFSRRIRAGDPSSYSFKFNPAGDLGNTRLSLIALTFSNPDPSAIYHVAPSAATVKSGMEAPSASGIVDILSVTSTIDHCIHVMCATREGFAGSYDSTPAGYTLVVDGVTLNSVNSCWIKTITPAGATGVQSVSASGGGSSAARSLRQSFLISTGFDTLLAANPTGACHSTAALTTAIPLAAACSGIATVPSVQMTTAIVLMTSPDMGCSISAALSTISRFAALAECHCSTFTDTGDLAVRTTGTGSTLATLSVTAIWQDVGFNFRSTIGFVADATKELGLVADFYPHTYSSDGINVIAGWLGIGPTYFQNLNVSRDRRVAGTHAKLNDGTQAIFRIKVPQAGNWLISLAIGDAGGGTGYEYVQLFDNGILITTYDHPAGTPLDRWIAADNLIYDETTWPSTGSTKTITHGFTDIGDGTAILTVAIGTPMLQVDNTQLAHVRLRIAPDQGALLRGHATGTCSTHSIITVLFSADAHGICSTSATLGFKLAAMASAFCGTTRTNLLPNTEALDHASWLKTGTTVTVDDALSPIGTMTADRLVENTSDMPHHFYGQPLIPSGTNVTWSIYAKAAGRTVFSLGFQSPGIGGASGLYNLLTGMVTLSGEGTAVMTDAGNGWYRCSLSWLTRGPDPFLIALLLDNALSGVYLGDGVSGIECWGSQVEVQIPASPYYPVDATALTTWTTLSTVIRCAGAATGACTVSAALTATPLTLAARTGGSLSIPAHAPTATIKWVPSPVVDLAGYLLYRGTTPGGPYPVVTNLGLLMPNLLLQSNDFTHAAWTKEGTIIKVNAHATDDTLEASELIQTVNTGAHRLFQTVAGLSVGTYVASLYLKARAVSLMTVRLFGDDFHSYAAEFDLAQGLITPESIAAYPGTIAEMTDLGNGWYRCSVAGLLAAGPASLYAELNNGVHAGFYAGDGTSSAFILRAQLERNASAFPYVGTLATALVGTIATNLTPGQTDYFVVTAYDTSLNESTPSPEVSKLIPYSLDTAITPAAKAAGVASTATVLYIGGALFLAASATGKSSATAVLLAPIQMAVSAIGTCSTVGALAIAAAASFASVSTVHLTTIAPITTAITLAADARGSAITIVRISVLPALMAAGASSHCTVTASLTAAIGFSSLPACTSTTNLPALTTAITLAAAATGSCSMTNALSFVGRIFASATGTCSSSVSLSTTARLVASAGSTCSTVAALAFATGQQLASVAAGAFSTQATLQTSLTPSASATGICSTAASLTSSGQRPLIDNVQERWAERGIERGIFGGGG